MLVRDRNVQWNMPQRTHESNKCSYSLRYMVLIYNGNRETNEFTY